jgi:hypothetical protein
MNSLPVTLPYTLITRSKSFSPQPNNSLIFQTLGEGYLNDHRSDLREQIQPPFRIVYRQQGDDIEILTIFHSARLFPEG